LAAPFVADMEVTEAAEVAKGDAAVAIEMVAANAVIDLRPSQTRRGFETSMESLQWRAAVEGSVGTLLVVDGAEGIKLQLKVSDGLGRCLFGEEELQGLVEAFDLAAGLGVIGRGVNALNAQPVELGLESDPATARLAAEDGGVVAEEASGEPELLDG